MMEGTSLAEDGGTGSGLKGARGNDTLAADAGMDHVAAAEEIDEVVVHAHVGLISLPGGTGTLTAADKAAIREKTGCNAGVRFRGQWQERALTVTGPPLKLEEARKLAMTLIKKNGIHGGRREEEKREATRAQRGKGDGKKKVKTKGEAKVETKEQGRPSTPTQKPRWPMNNGKHARKQLKLLPNSGNVGFGGTSRCGACRRHT